MTFPSSLTVSVMNIGRSHQCDIPCNDHGVSRNHGRLEWNFKTNGDLSNSLFLKEKNIINKNFNITPTFVELKKNY